MSQILEPEPAAAEADVRRQDTRPLLETDSKQQLILGLVFGVVFGFLLQKGGVAKYHVLIGQLLLADFTVLKVMLSAVAVGMVGIHFMQRAGLVEYHLKPTRYGANTLGGLLFGAGFALSPYCPGTGAAAVGQGNFDSWLMVAGMMVGSYLFAEVSGYLNRTIMKWGDRGKLTIHEMLNISRGVFVAVAAPTIALILMVLEFATAR